MLLYKLMVWFQSDYSIWFESPYLQIQWSQTANENEIFIWKALCKICMGEWFPLYRRWELVTMINDLFEQETAWQVSRALDRQEDVLKFCYSTDVLWLLGKLHHFSVPFSSLPPLPFFLVQIVSELKFYGIRVPMVRASRCFFFLLLFRVHIYRLSWWQSPACCLPEIMLAVQYLGNNGSDLNIFVSQFFIHCTVVPCRLQNSKV